MYTSPSTHNQIRSMKKTTTSNECELTPLVDSPANSTAVPRIRRIPTKIKYSPDDNDGRDPINGSSSETPKEASDNVPKIKVGDLEESLPRFGPLYSVHQPSVQATKHKAWEHVVKKSLGLSVPKREVVKEIYSTAVRRVEREAKEVYGHKISGTASDFRWMMIIDGCFFLQLAFLILGRREQLGYPSNDPIFGEKHNKKDFKKWIEAMFYVGNQIPLVVLRELMKQKFFQQVLTKGKWDPNTSAGLCKTVLYEVLVLPVLEGDNKGFSLKETIVCMGRGKDRVNQQQQQPCDLLHGLQNLVIGPTEPDRLSGEYEPDDLIDLEANEEAVDDRESTFPSTVDDGGNGRIRVLLNAIGQLSSALDDRKRIFPCATELKQAGIRIRRNKNGGAGGIRFRSYYLWAFLYLPALPVDDNTETILGNLKTFEISQQVGKNRREVGSYLRFMSDIIRTTRDAKLLARKGIIEGNSDAVEKLPAILGRLSSEDTRLTHEFGNLRRQIRDYSSPWIHYKGILNLVVFLTLLQTLFALLAYFRPPKSR